MKKLLIFVATYNKANNIGVFIEKIFLNNIKNKYFLFFYLGIYLITAIINDVHKITKTIL